MKTKNSFQELKNKPKAEIGKALSENRERLWNLRTDLAAGKVKNVREIKQLRKEIARLSTLLNQA